MSSPIESSHHPGHPDIIWAGSLADPYSYAPTGFAAWHRSWGVWVVLNPGDAFGTHPPADGILLTPEAPSDGAPDLAGRVAHLEARLEEALDALQRRSA